MDDSFKTRMNEIIRLFKIYSPDHNYEFMHVSCALHYKEDRFWVAIYEYADSAKEKLVLCFSGDSSPALALERAEINIKYYLKHKLEALNNHQEKLKKELSK